jgi:uncharacterized protein YndB with AHSA1/START domain
VVENRASRRIHATPAAIWAVAADGARLCEWFALVEASDAHGPPGPDQRHTVTGPWANGQAFTIDREVEVWEPERRVRWRDTEERLDGTPPEELWHRGSTLEIRLEAEAGATLVTLTGRQIPAPGWEPRLRAAVPGIEQLLADSLERLERLATR